MSDESCALCKVGESCLFCGRIVEPKSAQTSRTTLTLSTLWTEHKSPDGLSYWYNATTGVSTWENPEVKVPANHSLWTEHKSPDGVSYWYNTTTGVSTWENPEVRMLEVSPPPIPDFPPPETNELDSMKDRLQIADLLSDQGRLDEADEILSSVIMSCESDLGVHNSPTIANQLVPTESVDDTTSETGHVKWGDLVHMRKQWDKEEAEKKESARLASIEERRRALAADIPGAARRPVPPTTAASCTSNRGQPPVPQPGKTTTASYWPVSGAATTLEARVRSCWEEDVRRFYQRNNPSKLEDPGFLPHIFEKYKGREHELLSSLEKKYKKPI